MRNVLPFLTVLLVAACISTGWAQEKKPLLGIKESRALAKAVFDKADLAMNAAWAAAKQKLTETEFNRLKDEQKAWVAYRDKLARSPKYAGVDPKGQGELPLDAPAYMRAAAALADQRTEWLKGLIWDWPEDALTGHWIDGYGGVIDIVQRGGVEVYFVMKCVRGPDSHLGDIEGLAFWNLYIGWYSDKDLEEGKGDETNLSFNFHDRVLEITGANTKYYHGLRAYFDGKYVKTKHLDDKEQARTMKAAKERKAPQE